MFLTEKRAKHKVVAVLCEELRRQRAPLKINQLFFGTHISIILCLFRTKYKKQV